MMILSAVGDWINEIFSKLDGWLSNLTKFDYRFMLFYDTLIAPLSEWLKLVGSLLLIIVVISGIFALVKRMYKVVIVVAVIFAIFIGLSYLKGMVG